MVSERVFLAKCDDCDEGCAIEVTANNRVIAIFNVEGQFYALDGVCPHQGGPLGNGQICDGVVTCPWHQWQFVVESGESLFSPAVRQPTIELEIEDGQIYARFEQTS
ncbi:MAG: Rieske 2Fe-2S domain-containing protein [Planctomycetales bacterium]|nr:Rieske 2Fe-2S domain-containing protein [Planctomycetales bacterium]